MTNNLASTYLRYANLQRALIGGNGVSNLLYGGGERDPSGGGGVDIVPTDALQGSWALLSEYGAGDDIATGELGDDQLDLGDGADIGVGWQGADIVVGGADNDLIFGDFNADPSTLVSHPVETRIQAKRSLPHKRFRATATGAFAC